MARPVLDHQRGGLAGVGDRSAKQRVRSFACGQRRYNAGPLLDRVGLSRQRRLAGRQGFAFQQQRIGRNDIAGSHAQDIARNDGFHGDGTEGAVALDLGLERHRPAQDFRGLDGMSFLNRVEPYGEGENRHDDRTADGVAGDGGDDAGRQ